MPLVRTTTGAEDAAVEGAPELETWVSEALSRERRHGQVEVDGASISWMAWGDPDAPGVLLFHGYMAHARVFSVVGPLLAADRHVVAFDLSGMGDSGWRPTYTEEQRAAEAWAVAADAGLLADGRRPVLASHSYGSAVAMRVAEEHGDEIAGFCLTDMMMLPPAVLHAYMSDARLLTEAPPRRVRPTLDEALARFRLQPEQPSVQPSLVSLVARHALVEVDGGWAWKFDPRIAVDDMHGPDWWALQPPRFAALEVPRALVHGERSAILGPDAVAYVRGLLPDDVPVVAVPLAHHHVMLDQPVAWVTAVRALIDRW